MRPTSALIALPRVKLQTWSEQWGSNPQPARWQRAALPIELCSHETKNWLAKWVSNPRPLQCECSALPLSYPPRKKKATDPESDPCDGVVAGRPHPKRRHRTGAGHGSRTRLNSLEGWCLTARPDPHEMTIPRRRRLGTAAPVCSEAPLDAPTIAPWARASCDRTGSGNRIRTCDLRLMRPMSCRTALPRVKL